VATGNGRQYKQTVSFGGEFRKKLYRRSACNSLQLYVAGSGAILARVHAQREYDYTYTELRVTRIRENERERERELSSFPLSLFSLCRSYAQKLWYNGSRCGIYPSSVTPPRHSTPSASPLSTFLHASSPQV